MTTVVRTSVCDLVGHFKDLEDPRSPINRLHPLESIVVISIMGILAGANGPTAINEWAEYKRELLLATLYLPHGIPSKDVFWRVLSALKPAAFQACFANWLQALRDAARAATKVEQPILPIDGKTSRRSHDRKRGLGALHTVSVWATEYGLSLGQVACSEKSNEITAIPELLRLVDVRGAIVTIDAMGTQKAIAAQIVDGEGDFVLALKGNHETLFEHVKQYVAEQIETNLENVTSECHYTEEKGHGRVETRTYLQMPAPKDLPGFDDWKGLQTIGVAIAAGTRNGKEFGETRYYINSLPMDVKNFARAVRCHWGVENPCHWTLDFVYRDDESRIRNENLRENFAWLRRFTLSLLKQHQGKKSVASTRRGCGWSDKRLMEILTGSST